MIARHFGINISLKYLHSISDLSRLGMSIKDITNCCEEINLKTKAIQIDICDAIRMPLPAILYWQQQHFVVIYKISNNGKYFYIADPAQGKFKYCKTDFLKYWIPEGEKKGVAILVDPNKEFGNQRF